MPLTPAEVHNVAFKKPPIGKRGYDEEEVDAFLDIVEVELSRLIEENNDLRGHPSSGNGASAEGAADEGVDISKPASTDDGHRDAATQELTAALAAAGEENQRLQSHIAELERATSQGSDGAQQQVVQLQQQLTQSEQELADSRRVLEQAQQALAEAHAAEGSSTDETGGVNMAVHTQAVQVLALAQQTADQHLSKSKATADRLLADAQASSEATINSANQRAEQQIGEAEARARQLDVESTARATHTVSEAEQRAASITADFEHRKLSLEHSVEELRVFEREYRSRLRSYLESQMRDLDAAGSAEPEQDAELVEAPQG